jgi:hypothetical protein
MFLLYALVIGLLVGLLAGGSPTRLGRLQFRWKWVFAFGLLFQVVLFAEPVAQRVGDLGPLLYVASSGAVLVAVLRNVRIPGLAFIALGAFSNLAAIVGNGGFMPASPAAMAAVGKSVPEGYSNSALLADPALWPLTDIFAMPAWLPFANVFSVGDVLIGIGVVWTIVIAMRSSGAQEQQSLVSITESTDRSFLEGSTRA